MVQVCEESAYEMEVKEQIQNVSQEENEQAVDESLGDLNPKYYERVMSLRDAKLRMVSSYQVQAQMNINSPY